jgi:hypothetical protein
LLRRGGKLGQEGWISLHRKVLENWIWNIKKFDKAHAWLDLLLKVNHQLGKVSIGNKIVEVNRGETITSELKLSERWGWSRNAVRNFLGQLESDRMIEKKSIAKQYTVIRIINYGKYQLGTSKGIMEGTDTTSICDDAETSISTNKGQQDGNGTTNREQQKYINNNENNKTKINNEEKDNIIYSDEGKEFLSVLKSIENYPLDEKKDLELYYTIEKRYYTLDILEAVKDWATYKLDKPLTIHDNPRSQLNTYCRNLTKKNQTLKGGKIIGSGNSDRADEFDGFYNKRFD